MWNTFHSESKVLIVTDGDNDPAGTATMLGNGLEFDEWVAAIPNPSIETWLGLNLEGRGASENFGWKSPGEPLKRSISTYFANVMINSRNSVL